MKASLSMIRSLIAVAFVLLSSGCGGDPMKPELGSVIGNVTLNGEPLKNVEICFTPSVGRPSDGKTDEKGDYELVYIREEKGAKVGTHTVMLRSGKVDNSQLKPVEVKAGSNVINIACTAKPKQPNRPAPTGDAESE